jgi:GR25 family glycosyltransferase involved in LPS biosynthesis
MSIDEFEFYYHMDSIGYDTFYSGIKSIDELKIICKKYKRCVAFNSLGYLKFNITNKNEFKNLPIYNNETDGLYVYIKRYNKLLNQINRKKRIEYDNYTFYPDKDSPDNDIKFISPVSIDVLKELADSDPNCAGFNTIGFLKHKIVRESNFKNLNTNTLSEGLYVKNARFRVKLLCNWTNSKEVCNEWNHMSKGNYRWNDIEITWEDKNVDFYVIINKPLYSEFYKRDRTIIFQMEPWCPNPDQLWGVKTWGEWADPDESKFLQVRTHKKYPNNGFWQLRATYNDLKTMQFEKTKLISSICSSKYFDPGHIKRIDFLKFVEEKNDEVVKIDIYNNDNQHNFKNYIGPHPPGFKDAGIAPYKYYFMPENNEEVNFMTEKIWEPILTETLAFYWGCPNIADYIDPRAYILLDLNDFEKSFNIIKNAILNDEWSKRLEIIRMEKEKVLEYFSFFPTLERIIHKDFKFNYNPSDNDVKYHKYFNELINNNINSICFINIVISNENCNILNNLINTIIKLNIKIFDYVYIFNYGLELNIISSAVKSKIKIVNYSKNIENAGLDTLKLIKLFANYNKTTKLSYFNISDTSSANISDIINYVQYFLINHHNVCNSLLNDYDVVGCSVDSQFISDAWLTTSKYILSLDSPTNDNINKWIISGNNCDGYMICDITNDKLSNADHYNNQETVTNLNKLYEFDNHIRIKCINLERRNDRKQKIESLFTKLNLANNVDFYKAIDGQTLQATEEIINMFTGNDFGTRRSFIGCALSHYNIWQQLSNDQTFDRYLIVEDDIEIDNHFKYKLNRANIIMQNMEQYDILYLGYTMYRKSKEIYNEKIKTSKIKVEPMDTNLYIGGYFGYIITKSGANKLLKFIKENGIKHGIDYLPLKYGKEIGLIMYEVLPHLIKTEYVDNSHQVDSDIQYDYNPLF